MAIGNAAKELLSSVLKHRDKKTLFAIRESAFVSKDEVTAFRRLKKHVNRYGTFPARSVFINRFKIPYVRTTEPTTFYLDAFVDRAKYNVMKSSAEAFMDAMTHRDVAEAERLLAVMQTNIKAQSTELGEAVQAFDELKEAVLADYNEARMSGGMRGITCGWPELDQEIGGYMRGDLVAWIARLGKGKTMLLLYQAMKAALAGHKVLFISPEVPGIQLVRRIIGMVTGLNPRLIARGMLSTDTHTRMVRTVRHTHLPITFAAGNYRKSVPFIRRMIEDVDPDVVFVDAMYLVEPEKKRSGSGGRREVISDIAEELKDVATSNDIPVVVSAQFNRQAVKQRNEEQQGQQRSRRDPVAHLDVHKIGETDVIGQVASLVFVVEYGDPPNALDKRWIGIKKGREGEGGTWLIHYRFSPFNMDVIANANDNRIEAPEAIDEDDLDADLNAA